MEETLVFPVSCEIQSRNEFFRLLKRFGITDKPQIDVVRQRLFSQWTDESPTHFWFGYRYSFSHFDMWFFQVLYGGLESWKFHRYSSNDVSVSGLSSSSSS